MTGRPRTRLIGLGMLLLWAMILPAIIGQGCPGIGLVEPIQVGLGTAASGSGIAPPTITFTYPLQDVSADIGDVITITWVASAPNGNAAITLLLDPDRDYGNGNEIVILPLILASDPNGGLYALDTSSLRAASFRIVARITDGINPEQIVVAPGRLMLYGAGLRQGNVAPHIVVTEPTINRGVSQGDQVDIRYCGRDPDDDGKQPPTAPAIVLLLDLDDDPTNDLNLKGPDAEQVLASVCKAGFFPVEVKPSPLSPPVAYVLACFTDTDCGEPYLAQDTNPDGSPKVDAQGNPVMVTKYRPLDPLYTLTIDVGTIPPRENGDPYRIRATMWDRVNTQVSGYAPGTISITMLGSGTIDLANVGRTISGSKFLGFNHGDRAGFTGSDLGDIGGGPGGAADGVNDFVIVSRYGRGYEQTNTGTAHIIMGLPNGGKFASEIPLNSVGTFYSGSLLVMDETTGTDGVVSVTRLGDVTGDGKPDILFGMPYVEIFYDDHDDDPKDSDSCCYNDLRPNPQSTSSNDTTAEDIGSYDRVESAICSNDLDLMRETPIDGGYAVLVPSENNLKTGVRYFGELGQRRSSLPGVRWRGAWYAWNLHDYTQTTQPNMLDPYSRFGQTVSSMPPMQDTSLTISPRFGTTLLISATQALGDHGMVVVMPHQDWSTFCGTNAQSIPCYVSCDTCCRTIVFPGLETYIVGAVRGDHLGYAQPAGDYNLDGNRDILMGAPDADRDGLRQSGIVYVLFGRPDFPTMGDRHTLDLGDVSPPRMEIHGTRDDDHFGAIQTIVGDINQDGLPDVGFSSPYADGPGGVDSGFIGIVFGGRRLTGENIFTVDQVATAQLPGVKIYGIQPNGHAGTVINNAGDFNGDGMDDLLIVAPDEVRTIGNIQRRGVAYLIFGGTHLTGNKTFNLSQVGTADLPGLVFVSPYAVGSAEEAPIDWAGGVGDINSDGFDDILIGVSEADYVNPLEPSQRRNDSGEAYLIYGNNTGTNTTQR